MSRSATKQARPEEYFEWLCDLVYINEPDHSYFILAKTLNKWMFQAKIPTDENRADDGLKLREIFEDESGKLLRLAHPCTMLEFLIGLAFRMDGLMYENSAREQEDTIRIWFWEILRNVDLDMFDDEAYYDRGGTEEVQKIMNCIVNREYDEDGKGGLFPLSYTTKDQRKVEIWYQMQAYLNEKYPI